MTFPSHVVNDFIPGKLRRMKNIHWNLYISTFWRNISILLEELVPVMVSTKELSFSGWCLVFVTTDFFFFFFHTSRNDKILVIKHVFIVVWSISSLGPFCWRVLSDCAITCVPLHSTGQPGKLCEKKIFTFDFHILPEHRRIGGRIFPCRCISTKTAVVVWGRCYCWPIYLESKPSLNCWIAVERDEVTFISKHIIANHNSYHDDRST